MINKLSILVLLPFLVDVSLHTIHNPAVAQYLYTDSRWIVDDFGKRVKLGCVNWPSHLEPVLAEGLSKQPLDMISKKIRSMGFNCVRLTWPLYLATKQSLASVTVRQSFQSLGLTESIKGIEANNPSLLDLTLIQAYMAVVSSLGYNGVMVIIDNHLTKPGWCCGSNDKQGFFGDPYFDPDEWIMGLTMMAIRFNGTPYVVAMSLRNELRGPKQNVNDWYRYMQQAAEAVHMANPNVLVILSGFNFASDLSFLSNRELEITFTRKIVFEMHWYSFFNSWNKNNANEFCGSIARDVRSKVGYLLIEWPVILSEFGLDLTSYNMYVDRFLNCLLGFAMDYDLDWALWGLQGSYYLREGVKDLNETYGVLTSDWSQIKNPVFMDKLSPIQFTYQGPGFSDISSSYLIYHPLSGRCIQNQMGSLRLGSCHDSKIWTYQYERSITLEATKSCIQFVDLGRPVVLDSACSNNPTSQWNLISASMMLISLLDTLDGTKVCFDADKNGVIITNECKCNPPADSSCDPTSQWFKMPAYMRA